MADTNTINVANRILNELDVEEKLKEIVSKIPGLLDDATIRAGRKIHKVRDWLEKLEDALFDADEISEEAPSKKTDSKLVGVRKQLERLIAKKPDTNPINVADRILKELGVEEKLKEIVSKIRAEIIRAERNDPKFRDWLEELEVALFDAHEILEKALGKKTDSKLVRVRKHLEKLVEKKPLFDPKLVEVRKQLENLVAKKPSVNPDDAPAVDTEREISNDGYEIFGREDDKEALINLLFDSGIDETVSVISIIGLEGIGKTRLAQLIFDDARVKTSFRLRMWVGVSQLEFSSRGLADEIIKSKTGGSIIANPESKLEKFVGGRKLLLVLDDVQIQKIDPDRWLEFKRLLMSGAEGSRVLITTRSREVASMTATVPPYELKLLNQEMASKHFEKLYGDLPQHLKNFITYCSLLPKDDEFDESALTKIWVAQGFTGERNYNDSRENLEKLEAKGNLEKLEAKGFFERVKTEGSATQSKFKIVHGMHDLARFVGGKRCIKLDSVYEISGHQTATQSTHYVSFDFPLSSLRRLPTSLKSSKRIRSFVLFPYQLSGKSKDGSNQAICDAIVSNFKSLRALDLHYLGIKTVPPKIHSLEHLRYLDLSKNTKMKVLPNSIAKLRNLHTLKLSWCFGLQELPRDIKNLVELRHLEIDGCYNLTHMPSGLGELTNLQTLSQFVLSKEANPHAGELHELRRLNCLQGDLQIRNLRPGQNVRDICLEEKQGLKSLTLDWGAVEDRLDGKSSLSETITPFSLDGESSPGETITPVSLDGESSPGETITPVSLDGESSPGETITPVSLDGESSPGETITPVSLDGESRPGETITPVSLDGESRPGKTITPVSLDGESSIGETITIPRLTFNGYGGVNLPVWLSTSTNLVKLELRRCSKCKFLPPLHNCPALGTLVLEYMTKLEYIAEYHDVEESFFPSLKELRLTELRMLKGWWKSTSPEVNHRIPNLSKLSIEDCPNLVSMPLFPNLKEGLVLDSTSWKPFEQMMNMADDASSSSSPPVSLSHLMNLSIVGIKELDDIAANSITWKALESLQFLRLDSLSDLKSLPDGLQSITSLQELNIWRCNFTDIPDWIGELKSLKKLSIWVCPKIKSLPEKISSMTSLLTLEIEECPILLQRCLRNGADFDKISRIPNKRLGQMSKQ